MSPKKRTPSKDRERSRQAILDAAIRRLRRVPAPALTVDAIAREAGCAKGLVHYHFKTKGALYAAAADRIWSDRAAAWSDALAADDPATAIGKSWDLLTREGRDGVTRACSSLHATDDEVTGRAVRDATARFAAAIAGATEGLLRRVGLRATVPLDEVGALATSVIVGAGMQLGAGGTARALEGAYAAFWAGLLSLTERAERG